MTNDLPDAVIEKCLIAFLTEKAAQCGEPFYMDMWEEYKREKPEEYHEEFVQMQCALTALDISGILSDLRFYGDDTEQGQRARTRLSSLGITNDGENNEQR